MTKSRCRVAVVGAGFVGATLCHHLSDRGAQVFLFEALPGPAMGVTGASMGWVNTIMCDPETQPGAYQQRLEALRLFHDLNVRTGNRLFSAPIGSLVWSAETGKTEQRFSRHDAAGGDVKMIDSTAFGELAPQVQEPPEYALYSANDIALNPLSATSSLLECAGERGASVTFGAPVTCRVAHDGTAYLEHAGERLDFDVIVIAAGPMSANLLGDTAPPDLAPPSPMAMVTLEAEIPGSFPILCGPYMEVRRLAGNRFLAVCAPPEHPAEDAMRELGEERALQMRALFGNHVRVEVVDTRIGNRPMTRSGLPFAGKLDGASNLFAVSGHPGIICAPGLALELGNIVLS